MSYIKKTLTNDEKIIVFRKYHWIFLLLPVISLIFSGLFIILLIISSILEEGISFYEASPIILLIVLPFFLIFMLSFIKYISTEHAVTNKRIVFKSGFIRTNTDELRNTKLENIQIKQSILGRILSYGNLEFRGTGGSPVIFRIISHPISLKKEIEKALYKI